jgi:aminoglycoside phosphotransferase family enzyme/predicted kinase
MYPDEQEEVIRFLEAAATHDGQPVERIDTHASIVFLAGTRALKLKRAVSYDYLDFSTVARRRAMCERELLINRRTAPSIYRRIVPVTRASGGLALDGDGPVVEWLVEMQRFDGEALLDRLAAKGRLAPETMVPLAAAIAALHASAEPRQDYGGRDGIAWTIDGNAAAFAAAPRVFDPVDAARLMREARAALDRHAARLDARRAAGFVRQCHGDLHLRNIVLLDGVPTLFDAIEFNDHLACIDVMYDLAFLLMDLWRRHLPGHANSVLNAYLESTGDWEALALLPLFLSCRAAIRAKTSASAAALAADRRREELERTAREYLTMGGVLLRSAAPRIVAVGGLSGSGKSTIARALAPSIGAVPGAVIVRSDVIRKRLAGVDPLTRLGPEGYTEAMSTRVYASAIDQACRIAATGHSAVVDAVFGRVSDRQSIEQAARSAGVPFTGLWLDAPAAVLEARVRGREADVSDAGADVVRAQIAGGVGDIVWPRLDASREAAAVQASALSLLGGTDTA